MNPIDDLRAQTTQVMADADKIISILLQFKRDGNARKAVAALKALNAAKKKAAVRAKHPDGETEAGDLKALARVLFSQRSASDAQSKTPDKAYASEAAPVAAISIHPSRFDEIGEKILGSGAKAVGDEDRATPAAADDVNEPGDGGANNPIEQGPMRTETQSVEHPERVETPFQADTGIMAEFVRSQGQNTEDIRRATRALNDVLQMMKEQADFLKGLANVPAAIAELRAAQALSASQLQNHGP